MSGTTRAPRLTAATTARLALATLALLGVPTAGAAPRYRPEPYAAFQRQVAARDVRVATLFARNRTVHAALRDGGHVSTRYPPSGEHLLVTDLRAHGTRVRLARRRAHHGLRLRYVAAIAAGLVVALALAGVTLVRRRRARAPEQG